LILQLIIMLLLLLKLKTKSWCRLMISALTSKAYFLPPVTCAAFVLMLEGFSKRGVLALASRSGLGQ